MISVADLIRKGADAVDARKKFDPEVRRQYMNASEAMTCIRKQWYAKNMPGEAGEQDWGYARRGNAGEDYIVSRLRAANVPMQFTGDEQLGLRDDERHLSSTPDGLIWDVENDDGWIAVEFKTIDPRVNRAYLPKSEHITQVQLGAAMMADMGDNLPELGNSQIKGCKVVYMDASNFNDITEFDLPCDPDIMDRLEKRAATLLKATSAEHLPREGVETRGKSECKQRCAFTEICGVAGAGISMRAAAQSAHDLTSQVREFVAAKDAEATAKMRKDTAGEQLKSLLQHEGVSALDVDGHSVKLTSRQGSVSYAKVVKDHCQGVDLEPYRGASVEMLTVK
tara:strand:+ start:7121 stop:8134 length:1014 start_codon:yes stop_codon:yes gene_type:complete